MKILIIRVHRQSLTTGATSITLGRSVRVPNFGNTPIATGDICIDYSDAGGADIVPATVTIAAYGGGTVWFRFYYNESYSRLYGICCCHQCCSRLVGGTLNISAGLAYTIMLTRLWCRWPIYIPGHPRIDTF